MANDEQRGGRSKVGPGNPPEAHRWKKGQPSPNPKGRPPKRKAHDMLGDYERLRMLDNFAAVITKVGNITTKGEDPKSLIEGSVRNLYEIAYNLKTPAQHRVAAHKVLLDYYKESSRTLAREQEKMFNNALDHKERWSAPFRDCERRGIPTPNVYPHPDDVIIRNDGSVEIVGPMWPEQQRDLEAVLLMRGNIEECLPVLTDDHCNSADRKKIINYLRRRWNKLNKSLPPRLQRPFPVA